MRPGRVRAQELLLISGTGVPAGPVEQPAAVWQRAVLTFPLFDVLDFEQEVGIGGGLGAEIEDHGRRDELTHRHLRCTPPSTTTALIAAARVTPARPATGRWIPAAPPRW